MCEYASNICRTKINNGYGKKLLSLRLDPSVSPHMQAHSLLCKDTMTGAMGLIVTSSNVEPPVES